MASPFDFLSAVAQATGIDKALSTAKALTTRPGGLSLVGHSVYANGAKDVFLPLAVLLASAQRYVANDPLDAALLQRKLSERSASNLARALSGGDAALQARAQSQFGSSEIHRSFGVRQLALDGQQSAAYFDYTQDRWLDVFADESVLASFLPLGGSGRGVEARVRDLLRQAEAELVEQRQGNAALRKAFYLHLAESDDTGHGFTDEAYIAFLGRHPDIRLAALEVVLTSLLALAQGISRSGDDDDGGGCGKWSVENKDEGEAQSSGAKDPRPLVFNLVTVLGNPAHWTSLQSQLFDRLIQTVGVSAAEADAMRTAQARVGEALQNLQAVLSRV